jgi:hypothetical protein
MRSSSAREPNYYRRPAVLRATHTWLSRPFVGIADCANPVRVGDIRPEQPAEFSQNPVGWLADCIVASPRCWKTLGWGAV